MKKSYIKPRISVEEMMLDRPIAGLNCTADPDDMNSLKEVGFFGSGDFECFNWLGPGDDGQGGKVDVGGDGTWDFTNPDGICYHSNMLLAFLS